MKSCPVCHRTFDDTMSFCLIDGSILSAPFDSRAKEIRPGMPRVEPPETLLLSELEPTRAVQTSTNVQPPVTVASDVSLPFTTDLDSTRGPIPIAPQSSPMKTIVAPAPEPIIRESQAAMEPRSEAAPSGHRWIFAIAGLALGAVLVAGVVWLLQRNRSPDTPARSSLSTEKTGKSGETDAGSASTSDKTTSSAIAGATFNEKVNGIDITLVPISGGSFLMGSPASDTARDLDEGPQSTVTVKSFHISKFETTQAQYRAVMGSNPSKLKGDDLPVDSVSWNDAEEFCRKLSSSTGRTYRLPTEAEWEYAARAGDTSSSVNNLDAFGWCGGNSNRHTHPVGQKNANSFGLYDVYGNVWEWCQSEYKPYPYQDSDGRESLNTSAVHVLRGGSWESATKACRPTYRRRVVPEPSTSGFRIVLVS